MKKYVYILTCITVFVIAVLNVMNGTYSRKFTYKELSKAYNESLSVSDEAEPGLITPFVSSPSVYLPAGNYEVSVSYSTDADENYISFSTHLNKSDLDDMLYPMTAEEGIMNIPFELDTDTSDFCIHTNYAGTGYLNIHSIQIESTRLITYDSVYQLLFFCLLMILAGLFLFHKKFRITLHNNTEILCTIAFLLLIAFFASAPVLTDRVVASDDVRFHLTRIEGIRTGLLSGQFPVYLHSGTLTGYGHMASLYYPEAFLYIPAFLRIIGFSLTGAYHLFIIMINIATVGITWFSVKKVFRSSHIGLIAAVLYGLAPYRLSNLYIRGAIGEALAMAFLPLIIYGMYEIFWGNPKKWYILCLGFTCLLQSHILSILMVAAFLIPFGILFIYKFKDKRIWGAVIKTGAFTILLNLWFLVPMLHLFKEDLGIGELNKDFIKNAIPFEKLFFAIPSQQEIRLTAGVVLIAATIAGLYYVIRKQKKQHPEAIVLYCSAFGFLNLYMCTQAFPWRPLARIGIIDRIIGMLQFPWRFFAFATVFFVFSAAYGIYHLTKKGRQKILTLVLLLVLCLCLTSTLTTAIESLDLVIAQDELIDPFGPSVVGEREYLYKGTSLNKIRERGDLLEVSSGKLTVHEYVKQYSNISLNYQLDGQEAGTTLEVPLLYYKGYQVLYNDTQELTISRGTNNVMRIDLPDESSGSITIRYTGFLLWKVSFFVSLGTAFLLIAYAFYRKSKK